jgi:hypothetical protein
LKRSKLKRKLTSFEVLVLAALEERGVVNVKGGGPDTGPFSGVSLASVLLLHLRGQGLDVRVLFFYDLVSWEEDEVVAVEERVEKADKATQVVQVNGLELETMVLLDVEETQLEVVQGLLEGICTLLLFLVELLCHELVGWVFQVRAEGSQVLLLSVIIFGFDLTEFLLFSL